MTKYPKMYATRMEEASHKARTCFYPVLCFRIISATFNFSHNISSLLIGVNVTNVITQRRATLGSQEDTNAATYQYTGPPTTSEAHNSFHVIC